MGKVGLVEETKLVASVARTKEERRKLMAMRSAHVGEDEQELDENAEPVERDCGA